MKQGDDAKTSVRIIIAGRMAELAKLPFTFHTFSRIAKEWMIHGSIVRVINRNTSCWFSRTSFKWGAKESPRPSIGALFTSRLIEHALIP